MKAKKAKRTKDDSRQNNEIFRIYREKKNLTQEELAEKLGIIPRHYQKIETGNRNVTLSMLLRLMKELDMEFIDIKDWLYEEQKRICTIKNL